MAPSGPWSTTFRWSSRFNDMYFGLADQLGTILEGPGRPLDGQIEGAWVRVKELPRLRDCDLKGDVARPAGLKPAAPCLEGTCSIHLSYGRVPLSYRGTRHP